MTILSIVQDASREVGLPSPSTVVGNSDERVRQFLRLAEKDGKDLVRRYDWQILQKEQTFTSLAQETQTAIIPSDFSRFINETFYNRTRKRPFVGPLTPQEWQVQKSLTASVVVDAFRRRGNDLLVIPVPPAGDTFAFEYVSKYWVDTDADGDGDAEEFAADTDSPIFDEELITLGVIWRFKQARGFDYAEEMRSYEIRLARLFGDDGGKRTMDLMRNVRRRRPMAPEVPEGDWLT